MPADMKDDIAVTIAVPSFNEESNLEATVDSIIRAAGQVGSLPIEIILINDGSNDRTPQICDNLGSRYDFVRVIHHSQNRGLGESIRDSIRLASGRKWSVLPGDNDTPFDAIVTMLQNVDKADLVMLYFVNRELRGRGRNVLSTLFNTIYLVVFDVYVQYLNGPGCFPTKMLQGLEIYSSRFSILAEMRIKLLRRGVGFYEIPAFMQTGSEASTALSLVNLWEVMSVFLRLVWEVNCSQRDKYNKTPIRYLNSRSELL